MGRPQNYSVEIAARCERLIEALVDRVAQDPRLVDEWGGPLRTTFLLAMSTPMLVLPLERLFKPIVLSAQGIADDSALDEALGERVRRTLGAGRLFGDAEFYEEGAWAFVDEVPAFSVAQEWPADVFDRLDAEEARRAAARAPAGTILLCLRNGLAHGGVTYLDQEGRQTHDATNMLGFASYLSLRRREQFRVIRISVDAYQRFLSAWTTWLGTSGVQDKLTYEGPGWFEAAA